MIYFFEIESFELNLLKLLEMRLIPYIIVILCFAFSCSSSNKRQELTQTTKLKKVIPNQILVAEVEGMVCKMGCGGAIRREMIETNAVSRVEIDYQEGEKKQIVKIHFDNKLISQSRIVEKLEEMNKNQFKVFPIGCSEIHSSTSGSSSKSAINMSNMSEPSIELPNLIGILSSFISE